MREVRDHVQVDVDHAHARVVGHQVPAAEREDRLVPVVEALYRSTE